VAGVKNGYRYEDWLAGNDEGKISLFYGDSRKVLYDSCLALTASGTATLETGIVGRPMVIVYKTGFVSYQIARRLVKLNMIGLVNLVLGEKVVPELIQKEAAPSRIIAELERYLRDKTYQGQVLKKLNRVPGLLGGSGASERAAKLVSEYL
jgi:lipid-A-disaccharide synthase